MVCGILIENLKAKQVFYIEFTDLPITIKYIYRIVLESTALVGPSMIYSNIVTYGVLYFFATFHEICE